MTTVAFDARDAVGPQLRGWGRHVALLRDALLARAGFQYSLIEHGWRGPEVLFEQFGMARAAGRADLLHCPNCFLPTRRRCAGVVTVHDLAFEAHPEDFSGRTGWKYRTFTPRSVRSAQHVIAVSRYTRADVIERYGVDPDRVSVIPNAPALPIGDAPPPPGPYLLAVGDLRAKKNLGRLVDAFRLLRDAGLEHRLVLAGGDSGEGDALRERARGLPVEFTGYVPDERLDALMRGAAALVHPSLYEGFGLVIIEAMARGVPVACADATALPETAGGAAVLFDPGDPRAIARAIEEALTGGLIEAGRARAAQFSWEATAAATEDVYRRALGA